MVLTALGSAIPSAQDYCSIPQTTNDTHQAQACAIQSLSAYASCAAAFIIVAPEVIHHDTGERCDAATYHHRMWCRAEQFCHVVRNGFENMWFADSVIHCERIAMALSVLDDAGVVAPSLVQEDLFADEDVTGCSKEVAERWQEGGRKAGLPPHRARAIQDAAHIQIETLAWLDTIFCVFDGKVSRGEERRLEDRPFPPSICSPLIIIQVTRESDKFSLVTPILGLYAEMHAHARCAEQTITSDYNHLLIEHLYRRIQRQKGYVFPCELADTMPIDDHPRLPPPYRPVTPTPAAATPRSHLAKPAAPASTAPAPTSTPVVSAEPAPTSAEPAVSAIPMQPHEGMPPPRDTRTSEGAPRKFTKDCTTVRRGHIHHEHDRNTLDLSNHHSHHGRLMTGRFTGHDSLMNTGSVIAQLIKSNSKSGEEELFGSGLSSLVIRVEDKLEENGRRLGGVLASQNHQRLEIFRMRNAAFKGGDLHSDIPSSHFMRGIRKVMAANRLSSGPGAVEGNGGGGGEGEGGEGGGQGSGGGERGRGGGGDSRLAEAEEAISLEQPRPSARTNMHTFGVNRTRSPCGSRPLRGGRQSAVHDRGFNNGALGLQSTVQLWLRPPRVDAPHGSLHDTSPSAGSSSHLDLESAYGKASKSIKIKQAALKIKQARDARSIKIKQARDARSSSGPVPVVQV